MRGASQRRGRPAKQNTASQPSIRTFFRNRNKPNEAKDAFEEHAFETPNEPTVMTFSTTSGSSDDEPTSSSESEGGEVSSGEEFQLDESLDESLDEDDELSAADDLSEVSMSESDVASDTNHSFQPAKRRKKSKKRKEPISSSATNAAGSRSRPRAKLTPQQREQERVVRTDEIALVCTHDSCPSTPFFGTKNINQHLESHYTLAKKGPKKASFICKWPACTREFTSTGGVRYHLIHNHISKKAAAKSFADDHQPASFASNDEIESSLHETNIKSNSSTNTMKRGRPRSVPVSASLAAFMRATGLSSELEAAIDTASPASFSANTPQQQNSHTSTLSKSDMALLARSREDRKRGFKMREFVNIHNALNSAIQSEFLSASPFYREAAAFLNGLHPPSILLNQIKSSNIQHRYTTDNSVIDMYLPLSARIAAGSSSIAPITIYTGVPSIAKKETEGAELKPILESKISLNPLEAGYVKKSGISVTSRPYFIVNSGISALAVSWIPLHQLSDHEQRSYETFNLAGSPQYLCIGGNDPHIATEVSVPEPGPDAASCTKATTNDMLGSNEKSKTMLQIWCLPALSNKLSFEPTAQKDHPHQNAPPYLCLGLLLDFGSLIQIEWCPFGHDPNNNQLGIACLLFEDGKARVFSIPMPDATHLSSSSQHDKSERKNQLEFIALNDDPLFVLEKPEALLLKIRWLRVDNCAQILAGCNDGSVCIFDLTKEANTLVSSWISQDSRPIYDLVNLSKHKDIVVTSAFECKIKLWDTANVLQPIHEYFYPKSSLIRCLSFKDSVNIYCACTNGAVRMYDIDYLRFSTAMQASYGVHDHPGADVFALEESFWSDFIASCGEDGRLLVTKKSHTPTQMCRIWISVREDSENEYVIGDHMSWASLCEETKFRDTKNAGKVVGVHPLNANLLSLSFNPNPNAYRWIATGGHAGLVIAVPI